MRFTELTEATRADIIATFSDGEYAAQIVDSMLALIEEEDVGVAITACCGCLMLRIYDGEYVFPYPVPIEENADERGALLAIAKYAMREEIPLILTDVPQECVALVDEIFPWVRELGFDGECSTLHIGSGCPAADSVPEMSQEQVEIGMLTDEHISAHEMLCKDENVNKYWGYDYKNDESLPSEGYFYREAMRELELGVCVTFAVTHRGSFVGEGQIFAFDFLGGAELAVRLIWSAQGQGIGKAAVELLISAARNMGLSSIRARVKLENERSLSLMSHYMRKTHEDDGAAFFELSLTNQKYDS